MVNPNNDKDYSYDYNRLDILVGTWYIPKFQSIENFGMKYIKPAYVHVFGQQKDHFYDVAIIRLEQPQFQSTSFGTKIRTICLPDDDLKVDKTLLLNC